MAKWVLDSHAHTLLYGASRIVRSLASTLPRDGLCTTCILVTRLTDLLSSSECGAREPQLWQVPKEVVCNLKSEDPGYKGWHSNSLLQSWCLPPSYNFPTYPPTRNQIPVLSETVCKHGGLSAVVFFHVIFGPRAFWERDGIFTH